MPAPSVSPATPVWPIDADRTDEPVRLRRDVQLAEQRAAVDAGGPPVAGSTVTPRIRDMSMTSPPSVVEWPELLWAPDRIAISRSRSRPNRIAAATAAASVGRAMSAGRRSL